EDLPASLLALAQALSVTERQLHGSLLNMGVVSLICGALFRGSLALCDGGCHGPWARIALQVQCVLRGVMA
ncbi:hypothetical protein LYZ95_12810, partial [Xanthomonas hortorum pv. vitians]|uniref:hypothetical protein n=1 Tax=Xanthomonas hortorum TaxID=56454 RepID=UPI001F3C42C5